MPETPFTERRVNRLALPVCPECQQTAEVTLRTAYALYLECTGCGYVWAIDKPRWAGVNGFLRKDVD
jgi:hypothetical protein